MISVNYRSESIFWSRNPGVSIAAGPDSTETSTRQESQLPTQSGLPVQAGLPNQLPGDAGVRLWTKTVIDTPGSSETGRLVDINGDGRSRLAPEQYDLCCLV